MKTSSNRLFAIPLVVVALATLAVVPLAEARDGGRGGGQRAAAKAGGGGGGRQIDNSRRDARSNNVRSTSVNNVSNRNNNVNVNRNVNVDVDRRGGCCGGGWDNDYHPIATAAAVTATVAVTSAVVGSIVRSVPANCVPVNYGGMIYQQCGSTWYQPQGGQYVVINPPY